MAGFDEKEAEAIASNWVQNLRFRFARMGLNYHSDAKDVEKSSEITVDSGRKHFKDAEERVINDRKSLTIKDKVVLTDLDCEIGCSPKSRKHSPDLLSDDISSPGLDQGTLISARSDKSQVNLKSLREKRLNFFQQQNNPESFKDIETVQLSNVTNTFKKSVVPEKSQNVLNERIEFDNCVFDTQGNSALRSDDYNKLTTSKAAIGCTKSDNDILIPKSSSGLNSNDHSKNIAWVGSMFNSIGGLGPGKILPKAKDVSMSSKLYSSNSNDSLTTNKLPHNSAEACRNTIGTIPGFNNGDINFGFGNESAKWKGKDAIQVFPIELDDDDFNPRVASSQPDLLLNGLDYDSDSDSDYTLDDPISRHSSPRIEEGLILEHLQQKSGTMSPLALSVSPPAPQITGALYHEFSWSDEEEPSNTVANGDNDKSNKVRQRPRSLSHPSTARDCESPYSYCYVSSNKDVNVVCSVSSTKECVDVELNYGCSGSISNGWLESSELSLSIEDRPKTNSMNNFKTYSHIDLPTKQFERMNVTQNNSVKNSCTTSSNKNIDYINEKYFDVCVCPECDEINRGNSNWCTECGSALTSTKPISSKTYDLHNGESEKDKPLPIPKKVVSKHAESSKVNESGTSSKKPVSVPNANVDSQSQQVMKKQPKQNGRRWEKSNLSWSTFKDSHLSKPPSTRNFKNHPTKNRVGKESADACRPRSTSCRNPGKRGKAENGGGAAGSLPKSYKFQEFNKKKKGSFYDHESLSLKGIKASERKKGLIADKTNGPDSTNYNQMTEMIRTNRETPQPYLCLPDEIILRIFCHLSHADLARCSRVCRHLERIAKDEILWRTIVLRRNQNISDECLEKIGSKKPVSLSLIKCHGNLVTSSGLRELFRRCAENLQELNFIGCNGGQLIGESILLHVALRCSKLRSVDASWSNVGDNGVEALVQNVERLESLCLNGCQAITDHSLKVVADKHGESLRTFEIFGCFNVSAAAIKRLGQKCLHLETLNLGQCYKITSADIGRLVSHLGSIVNLDLRGCKQARDTCVKTIVKHCPHLVNLVLANCPLITDVAMSEIATNLSAVRCLDLCGCVKVTDHGVRALARSCNRLNSLDLSSTSITQKSVMMLANYCSQNLQSLKLSFCVDVTDDSVSRLVKHCKRMKILHLYGCKRLRNVKKLQQLNQSLKLEF